MINFFIKILLIISLWFNIALYFNWIDVGQYKSYIDKWVQMGQEMEIWEKIGEFWETLKTKVWENDLDNLF